jgi:hypothetical protein
MIKSKSMMKKITIIILFCFYNEMVYSQIPVKYLHVNILTREVSYDGYIMNSDIEISEGLLRKYMNNDSLFSEKFVSKMEADSIILITPELTNYLRFTNPVSDVYTVYDFRNICKEDIKEALLLDAIRFWPGEILLSGKDPDNPPWTNEKSKLISLGNFNGKEYILFNKFGNDISKGLTNDLIAIIQKSKPNEKLLEEKLRKFQLVLVSYLIK